MFIFEKLIISTIFLFFSFAMIQTLNNMQISIIDSNINTNKISKQNLLSEIEIYQPLIDNNGEFSEIIKEKKEEIKKINQNLKFFEIEKEKRKLSFKIIFIFFIISLIPFYLDFLMILINFKNKLILKKEKKEEYLNQEIINKIPLEKTKSEIILNKQKEESKEILINHKKSINQNNNEINNDISFGFLTIF